MMTNTSTRKGKTNKTKTLQVRLTQVDYEYLMKAAETMGTDASKLVRQLVMMSINAVKASEREAAQRAAERKKAEESLRKADTLLYGDIEVSLNEDQ